ncbi:hypothetical protein BJ138DRAFT_1145027 [Hygrophoropsis aurantiaca]|uniref:Uncharacterized protein n=1 Tax=Hygrophoropsis aurantiaca TaxID=72124 RepID=A0ACB8AKY8_9AGAM|nr:hypothetical protein BJ138DRAFT_1145027 [Hygrophoropsis aurantiaca]
MNDSRARPSTKPRGTKRKRTRSRSRQRFSSTETRQLDSAVMDSADNDSPDRDFISRRRDSRHVERPLYAGKGKQSSWRQSAPSAGSVSRESNDNGHSSHDATTSTERTRASSSTSHTRRGTGNAAPLRLPGSSVTQPFTTSSPSIVLAKPPPEQPEPDSNLTRSPNHPNLLSSAHLVLPPTPVSIAPLPLPLPISPIRTTHINSSADKSSAITSTALSAPHLVHLTHHGHPLTYDLNALTDDPKDAIALLGATRAEPGAYLTVGAHYRRTGRSAAACVVIQALLRRENIIYGDQLCASSNENQSGANDANGSITVSPPSCSIQSLNADIPAPIRSPAQSALLRPAMLLLAACELDLKGNAKCSDEKISHAAKAYDLFRAVYGTETVGNIDIVKHMHDVKVGLARLGMPKNSNALGLEFSASGPKSTDFQNRTLSVPVTPRAPRSPASARIKALEEELAGCKRSNSSLDSRLVAVKDLHHQATIQLTYTEQRARHMENKFEDLLDDYKDLQRRLAKAERDADELRHAAVGAEARLWGKMRDILSHQLGSA